MKEVERQMGGNNDDGKRGRGEGGMMDRGRKECRMMSGKRGDR